MADTVREQIIQALVSRLSVVTQVNGYNTDMGGNVLRALSPMPSEVPGISLWPQPEESEKQYGKNLHTMPVRIEGLRRILEGEYPDPPDYHLTEYNPSVISEMILGDIIKCVTSTSWSNLVDSIEYIAGGTDDYPEPGDEIAGAFASFNIKYKTVLGDPYAQS